MAESKAGRCFYVANAYLISGKQLEAHALFGRAAQHAKQAVKQHKVGLLILRLHAQMGGVACLQNHEIALPASSDLDSVQIC